MGTEPFDLVTAPACCRSAFLEGRMWERVATWPEAYRAGYEACDAEISTLQREAARLVHALAESPPRDVAADERRAERSRSWWARRRGEATS